MATLNAEAIAETVLNNDHVRSLRGCLHGVGSGVFLVGGAVRDLLLGLDPDELDIAVELNAADVSEKLIQAGGAVVESHERFGTARVAIGGVTVDLAETRMETYPRPGALPEVERCSIEADLKRRDFTVNAIAVELTGPAAGRVLNVDRALEDLDSRVLRVLHNGSFIDDPTRLWRLARYAGRLGFNPCTRTLRLANEAVTGGAVATVSAPRHGSELVRTTAASEPTASVSMASKLGLLEAIGLNSWDQPAFEAASLRLADVAEVGTLRLAVVFAGLLEAPVIASRLELPIQIRRVCSELSDLGRLREEFESADSRLQIHRICSTRSPVALAVAATMEHAPSGLDLWFDELQGIENPVSGADLVRAGVPEGPDIQIGLDAALSWTLDSGGSSRDVALAVALDAIGLRDR